MIRKNYVLSSLNGLSSRSSSLLVSFANHFESEFKLIYQDEEANLKSIMNVMSLVIKSNEEFSIEASGKDEVEAMEKLDTLLKEKGLIK